MGFTLSPLLAGRLVQGALDAAAAGVTCQCWKVAVAGARVSVTVVTGMPSASASFTWAATSGVAFWLL